MLDDESRIARIRAERWIPHATAIGILESLQEAFTQPRSERMKNVLLIAESGMGKTSLIRKFERNNIRACDPRVRDHAASGCGHAHAAGAK